MTENSRTVSMNSTISQSKMIITKHNVQNVMKNLADLGETNEFEQELLEKQSPSCGCSLNQAHQSGPYYTQLGKARSLSELRRKFESQTGTTGASIRIQKIAFKNQDLKSKLSCPKARQIVRRSSVLEKYLLLVKKREGHTCDNTWIVVNIVVWDGISNELAAASYNNLSNILGEYGEPKNRYCAKNYKSPCMCQGTDNSGSSYSFGCSWASYSDGCKFSGGLKACKKRKFMLNDCSKESQVEDDINNLANYITPLFKRLVPEAYSSQTAFDDVANDCRIGRVNGEYKRPFSGATCVVDFCAHSHKDRNNMEGGCSAVVTLTKPENRTLNMKPEDEQFHVLPNYDLVERDEPALVNSEQKKEPNGSLGTLSSSSTSGQSSWSRDIQMEGYQTSVCNVQMTEIENKESSNSKKLKSSINNFLDTNMVSYYPSSHCSGSEPNNKEPHWSLLDLPMLRCNPQPMDTVTNAGNLHWSRQKFLTSCSNQQPMGSAVNAERLPHWSKLNFLMPCSNQQPIIDAEEPHWSEINFLPRCNEQPIAESLEQSKSFVSKSEEPEVTDNAALLPDDDIGGVAIALTHGSVLFECAKHELHATTALKKPNRFNPTRIGLVFYQHKKLNKQNHGWYSAKNRHLLNLCKNYNLWHERKFTPSERQLKTMRQEGFQFPDDVETISHAENPYTKRRHKALECSSSQED